jgi:hypothetical protein
LREFDEATAAPNQSAVQPDYQRDAAQALQDSLAWATLDNGGGPFAYVVTGVFRQLSLDGGTHPGYFTISNQIIAATTPCGAGNKRTIYSGNTIGQSAYSFKTLTLQ